MKYKILIFAIVLVFVSFVGGYFVSQSMINYDCGPTSTNENCLSEGDCLSIAYQNLIERGHGDIIGNLSTIRKTKEIRGTIHNIESDKITLGVINPSILANKDLDERIVLINNNTKIYTKEDKDPEIFSQELENYRKELTENPESDIESPELYNLVEINLSDLSKNRKIQVISEEFIQEKKEFTASEIILEY